MTVLKTLEKKIKEQGLGFDLKKVSAETIVKSFENKNVLDAYLRAVRKELDMAAWIKKYGACKENAENYKVPGIKMVDDSFTTLENGNFSH